MSIRAWGRVPATPSDGAIWGQATFGGPQQFGPGSGQGYVWQVVETDANGFSDYVYITALVQCLKLNLGESPFWADWGIPAQRSVTQQVFPNYYVTLMQQRYSKFFASLQITQVQNPTPTYNVYIVTNQGVVVQLQIPV